MKSGKFKIKSWRLTKRKKAIIELLSKHEVEELQAIHEEHGLFSFSAISVAVFDCKPHEIKDIERISLYRTLREMVEFGYLVTREEPLKSDSKTGFKTRWHLNHKMCDDLDFIRNIP